MEFQIFSISRGTGAAHGGVCRGPLSHTIWKWPVEGGVRDWDLGGRCGGKDTGEEPPHT